MMLGRDLLAPSSSRAPEFDTARRDSGTYQFSCLRCAGSVATSFQALIDSAWNYERVLAAELLAEARQHFGIETFGKAHDGGWVSLMRVTCPACQSEYIMYASVREPANEWYQVTIQGVVELRPEPQA